MSTLHAMRRAGGALLLGLFGAAALLVAACTGPGPSRAVSAQGAGEARCPVCARNGDLACVEVEVDEDTPTLELDGTTYHFCSDDCRETFRDEPDGYR